MHSKLLTLQLASPFYLIRLWSVVSRLLSKPQVAPKGMLWIHGNRSDSAEMNRQTVATQRVCKELVIVVTNAYTQHNIIPILRLSTVVGWIQTASLVLGQSGRVASRPAVPVNDVTVTMMLDHDVATAIVSATIDYCLRLLIGLTNSVLCTAERVHAIV